jgi:hypothetical protein
MKTNNFRKTKKNVTENAFETYLAAASFVVTIKQNAAIIVDWFVRQRPDDVNWRVEVDRAILRVVASAQRS